MKRKKSIYHLTQKQWKTMLKRKRVTTKQLNDGWVDYYKMKYLAQVKRKPIQKISKTRFKRLKVYGLVVHAWRQKPENKICRKCGKKASPHPHHKNGRLGTLLIESSLFIPLCQKCHDWVHDNPDAARKENLLAKIGQWNTNPFKGKI